MNLLPIIPSVRIIHSSIIILLSEALINHVPDVATLEAWLVRVPKVFPVEVQISIGISHGMTVFTQDDRTILIAAQAHV